MSLRLKYKTGFGQSDAVEGIEEAEPPLWKEVVEYMIDVDSHM